MENIELLISRYLDSELNDDEISQLAHALETDVSSVDRLVFQSFIHAQLLHWMDQQDDRKPQPASMVEDNVRMARMKQPLAHRARRRLFSLVASAAVLLIATSISIVWYVVASRPTYIGQVTDATACKWGASHADVQVGTLVKSDQDLDLIEGRAVLTFSSGAKLMLEAPSTVHLVSPMQIRLIDGRIAAKVPRTAAGFAVNSTLARIFDLGTAFTLTLKAEKSFDLRVFEGMVEMQLDKRFGEAVHRPVRVAEFHAASFDAHDGDIKFPAFEEGAKLPF